MNAPDPAPRTIRKRDLGAPSAEVVDLSCRNRHGHQRRSVLRLLVHRDACSGRAAARPGDRRNAGPQSQRGCSAAHAADVRHCCAVRGRTCPRGQRTTDGMRVLDRSCCRCILACCGRRHRRGQCSDQRGHRRARPGIGGGGCDVGKLVHPVGLVEPRTDPDLDSCRCGVRVGSSLPEPARSVTPGLPQRQSIGVPNRG